jgi:hypothetical protein
MITSMILLYFTVFVFFQWGQRIAMTRIDTKAFLILMLLLWISIKSIT